jgi:hypothetical protein
MLYSNNDTGTIGLVTSDYVDDTLSTHYESLDEKESQDGKVEGMVLWKC